MRRQERRAATRQHVLAVAAQMFEERGFDSTTVRDIAQAAGVSVGTVMAVGDKSALLVEVFDARIGEVHENRAVSPTATDGDAVDALLHIFAPFVEMFAANPTLAQDYAAALVSGKHRAGVFHDLAVTLRREISQTLQQSGISPEVADQTAIAVHLAYLGTLFMSAGTGDPNDPKPAEDFVAVLQHLTIGRSNRDAHS
jgi:AcrR family transcriptional regulator